MDSNTIYLLTLLRAELDGSLHLLDKSDVDGGKEMLGLACKTWDLLKRRLDVVFNPTSNELSDEIKESLIAINHAAAAWMGVIL